MKKLARVLRGVRNDSRGLETLEYAVFAVAFVVIIGGVVAGLSGNLTTAYGDIGNWISGQASKM